ncbi:hypothetical protein C8J56DRAFT_189619 [Mycena floridula]|nr:hypothetical protein C8J56DRAFT_189619 [Mycena floridula]
MAGSLIRLIHHYNDETLPHRRICILQLRCERAIIPRCSRDQSLIPSFLQPWNSTSSLFWSIYADSFIHISLPEHALNSKLGYRAGKGPAGGARFTLTLVSATFCDFANDDQLRSSQYHPSLHLAAEIRLPPCPPFQRRDGICFNLYHTSVIVIDLTSFLRDATVGESERKSSVSGPIASVAPIAQVQRRLEFSFPDYLDCHVQTRPLFY